jgi:hypothetical protein
MNTAVLDQPLGLRIGISNARPVQGCPQPVARNQPYVASKLRSRVAASLAAIGASQPERTVPNVGYRARKSTLLKTQKRKTRR